MAKREKTVEESQATLPLVADNPIQVDILTAPQEQKQEDNPDIIALKKQLSDAEEREKSERLKRIEAEKAASEANTKAATSQNDAVSAQKTAIENAVQIATGNINTIKRELREAMEGGDLDKQVELNEKLADARWSYNNAVQTQKKFSDWEEKQKSVPKQVEQKPQYSRTEQAWIDAHPRFNTDDEYYGVVAGADAAARRKGIQPDTKAYYEYVEAALVRSGLEGNNGEGDNNRDTTGSIPQQDDEPVIKQKPKLVMPSAPAANAAPASPQQRSARSFKLTPEMQDIAHRMFGPNSSHKLTDKQAEEKYATWQLDIQTRRANGERI